MPIPWSKMASNSVPSITRVFRKDQNLYVYMEVYDPTLGADQKPSVAATLSFYRGKNKMFESEPVRLDSFLPQRGQTLPVQFQVPLVKLPTAFTYPPDQPDRREWTQVRVSESGNQSIAGTRELWAPAAAKAGFTEPGF